MIRDAEERREHIEALTLRYALGEFSEEVFTASLKSHCTADEIRHLVLLNHIAYRNSTNYKRGLYR